MSTDACKASRIRLQDKVLKASDLIHEGQLIEVRKNGFQFLFEVIKPIGKRVSASEAALCYHNKTSPEELNKFSEWHFGSSASEFREKGDGRPTKKERREIDDFKDNLFEWDE